MKKISSYSFNNLTLLSFKLYFVEVVLGGPGQWSKSFLGVDLRFVFFGLICAVLFAGILKLKLYKSSDVIALFLGLFAFAFWLWILPSFYQTKSVFSLADGVPIFSIFTVTFLFKLYLVDSGYDRYYIFRNVSGFVFLLSIFIAIAHIILYFILVSSESFGDILIVSIKLVLDSSGAGSIYIGPMPDGSIRIFWITSLFLFYGLYRSVIYIRLKLSISSILLFSIFVVSIFITQTRSMILAIPFALLSAFVLYIAVKYLALKNISLAVAVTFLLILITFIQLLLMSTNVIFLLGLSRDVSDHIRDSQASLLLEKWFENFFIGFGFGASAGDVRSDESPFSYELSILALYMKIGVVGMSLAGLYFLYLLNAYLRINRKSSVRAYEFSAFAALLVGYFFIFNTNPYLSNSVGVAICILLTIEAFNVFGVDFSDKREIGVSHGV